ncbi:IS200/IS605 family transposase (plasmid) [Microvirga sp. VF16]|nr:IS200/IS605 family transposase [Microvirga sp. VF16]
MDRLREFFASVCSDFEVDLREFNGESDHVHLLVFYPPKVRLSDLVNSLKGVSSRRLQQEFPAINAFWSVRKRRGMLWSPSYFAGSVGGAPLEILKTYIKNLGRGLRRVRLYILSLEGRPLSTQGLLNSVLGRQTVIVNSGFCNYASPCSNTQPRTPSALNKPSQLKSRASPSVAGET